MPTRVMFMQSQSYFGSDSMIHSLLMRNFDRDQFKVYAAVNRGTQLNMSASLIALQGVPDLTVRPVNFGPSYNSMSFSARLRMAAREGVPGAVDLLKLAGFVRRNKIDIIHGTEKPRDAFYGVLLAKLSGAKSVVHLHVKCESWISPLVQWAMGQADALIGVSQFVAQSIVDFGYPAAKVFHAVNALDASRWDPEVDGLSLRNEFGIAPDVPLLAINARMYHWKGHTRLVEALGLVKRRVPHVKLLIVGEDDPRGDARKGSYTTELAELASRLGVLDNIIFTGFRNDIAQVLAATDIYCMPTFEEPCAVAFLEAMAMEKPIIALRSGGTPEMVDDGKAGLLSEPGDNEALADNIVRLISSPEERVAMGTYARCRVLEYYTPRRLAANVEAIYHRIL